MTRRVGHGIIVLAGLGGIAATTLFSSETRTSSQPGAGQGGSGEPQAESESAIEVFVRHAMPSKRHRLLDRMAGQWKTAVKYWMRPDVPAVESEGTASRKWVLDGRFLHEEFDGGNLALPFRGQGFYGFDGFEQKYTSVWLDTMSTAITTYLGTYDEGQDLVNFVGRYGNPWAGQKVAGRGVMRFTGKDHHVLEMYIPTADGREFKTLEIGYTRLKTPPASPPAP